MIFWREKNGSIPTIFHQKSINNNGPAGDFLEQLEILKQKKVGKPHVSLIVFVMLYILFKTLNMD